MFFDLDKINFNNKIKSIFLLFMALIGNFLTQILPCNLQTLFNNNMIVKHLILFMLIYFTNHVYHDNIIDPKRLLLFSLIIYFLFLLFSKQSFNFSFIIIVLLCVEYILHSYISFYKNKLEKNETNDKSKQENKNTNDLIDLLKKISVIILYIILVLLIIGSISYYNKQKNTYKNNFDIIKFIFGVNKCKNN